MDKYPDYHSGFQFGVACAIVDVIPDISDKSIGFQKGFTGGFAAAETCMEARVRSRIILKDIALTYRRPRERRFTHEPKIEGRPFNDRIEEKAPKTRSRSRTRRASGSLG